MENTYVNTGDYFYGMMDSNVTCVSTANHTRTFTMLRCSSSSTQRNEPTSHIQYVSLPVQYSYSIPYSGPFTFHFSPRAGNCACRCEREALKPQGNFNSVLLLLSRLETTLHLPDASRATWRFWAALGRLHPGAFAAPAHCTVCAGRLLCLTPQSHAIMCVSWITICKLLSLTHTPTHGDTHTNTNACTALRVRKPSNLILS